MCQCEPGYIDIRKSEKRTQLFGPDTFCLKMRDIDECALGITNCSGNYNFNITFCNLIRETYL